MRDDMKGELGKVWGFEVEEEVGFNPTIQPMHNRVLVERMAEPECSHGKIIVPDIAKDVSIFCKVIAVGPGRWEDGVFTKTAVKPGDVVLVPGVGNKYPDWQDGEQILITDKDIGAIVG